MLQGRCCRQRTPETQITAAVLKGPKRHMLVLSLGLSDVWVSTPSCSCQAQKGCCVSVATDHVNTAQELYDGRWDSGQEHTLWSQTACVQIPAPPLPGYLWSPGPTT